MEGSLLLLLLLLFAPEDNNRIGWRIPLLVIGTEPRNRDVARSTATRLPVKIVDVNIIFQSLVTAQDGTRMGKKGE